MYVKQEMYVVDGGVFETILVQMNRSKEGAIGVWAQVRSGL